MLPRVILQNLIWKFLNLQTMLSRLHTAHFWNLHPPLLQAAASVPENVKFLSRRRECKSHIRKMWRILIISISYESALIIFRKTRTKTEKKTKCKWTFTSRVSSWRQTNENLDRGEREHCWSLTRKYPKWATSARYILLYNFHLLAPPRGQHSAKV